MKFGFGGNRTAWSRVKKSGKLAKPAIRNSPAPICSGGTTWRQTTTSARHRAPSTKPTVANCQTASRSPPIGVKNSAAAWANFRCSIFGAPTPISRQPAGSPKLPSWPSPTLTPPSRWSTCRISITTCNAMARTSRIQQWPNPCKR